jgi:lysophosphatidate acyltransferase
MPLQVSIMAKQSLRWSPLGLFMSLGGTIFVDRSNSAAAVRSMRAAGEGMRTRCTSLIMYPEGTRTSQEVPGIIPFKKGGFHLAIQAGIPIVPVVTENYWRLYHKGVFESGTIKVRGRDHSIICYFLLLPKCLQLTSRFTYKCCLPCQLKVSRRRTWGSS